MDNDASLSVTIKNVFRHSNYAPIFHVVYGSRHWSDGGAAGINVISAPLLSGARGCSAQDQNLGDMIEVNT
jgi:hypothetical protein